MSLYPGLLARWGSDLLGREILEIMHNLFPYDRRECAGVGSGAAGGWGGAVVQTTQKQIQMTRKGGC